MGLIFTIDRSQEMSIDDTTDFIKEELQFRRSSQSRMRFIGFDRTAAKEKRTSNS